MPESDLNRRGVGESPAPLQHRRASLFSPDGSIGKLIAISWSELMARKDKRQRHHAKRDAKKRDARRQASVSPIKRLADAKGEFECWMSPDFEKFGQRQIFAFKQAGSLCGYAAFLIDRGVVGLKDAWIRMGSSRSELIDLLNESRETWDLPIVQTTLDQIRPMIAASIRWTIENGMRLPKDWQKAASLLGGVGDWKSADTSVFVKEFRGHPEDLRQRLLSMSYEDYVKRDDIAFTFNESVIYMDQETGEYVNSDDDFDEEDWTEEELAEVDAMADEFVKSIDNLMPIATRLAEKTRQWLASQQLPPQPELFDAWKTVLAARLLLQTAMPEADDAAGKEFFQKTIEGLAGRIPPDRLAAHRAALDQVLNHLTTDLSLMEKVADDDTEPQHPLN